MTWIPFTRDNRAACLVTAIVVFIATVWLF